MGPKTDKKNRWTPRLVFRLLQSLTSRSLSFGSRSQKIPKSTNHSTKYPKISKPAAPQIQNSLINSPTFVCEKFRSPTFLALSIFHTSKTATTILNHPWSRRKAEILQTTSSSSALQALTHSKFLQKPCYRNENPRRQIHRPHQIHKWTGDVGKWMRRTRQAFGFLLLRLRDRKKMGGWGTAADRRQESRTVCCCGRFGWRGSLAFAGRFCHVAALQGPTRALPCRGPF